MPREEIMRQIFEDRLEQQEHDWRAASEQMMEAGVDLSEANEPTLH